MCYILNSKLQKNVTLNRNVVFTETI